MIGAIWRLTKAAPVTVGIVAVAIGLYVAVKAYEWRNPREADEAFRACGAVSRLVIFAAQGPEGERKQVPQLYGPFDLWDGQWWRIPISGFHHANLLHLVMNGLAILFLGQLLESRLKKSTYLAFFLAGTTLSLIPEFLMEQDVVGLSGGAYAMFGALMVLRHADWRVAEVFTDQVVRFGIVWLFGCVLLTALEIVHIANAAHFTGFAYGWVAGQLMFGSPSRSRPARWSFLASHALIVPAVYFTMHPVWNGRYHWYLAEYASDPQQIIEHLEQAVARDPSLRRPWVQLAQHYFRQGDWQRAWTTALIALEKNRSDDDDLNAQYVQYLWNRLTLGGQQDEAWRLFQETFGAQADAFQKRLGLKLGPLDFGDLELVGVDPPRWNDRALRALVSVLRDGGGSSTEHWAGLQEHSLSAPGVDPDRPDSAVEGVTL